LRTVAGKGSASSGAVMFGKIEASSHLNDGFNKSSEIKVHFAINLIFDTGF